ncbi:type II toxin-antitoxin system RelE family toxin [Caballeronia sordidicola]|uniref:RelE/StbE replicon stabilization toxin n=1 Tax=Caballeronia sordidicola TaxID=196367 RepID=A0A242M4T2_CABSO|nr:type II toxin-antitoxin system RelE/ParE family toxin [Caballeronia sordidicola]OTP66104.1 RelE/StbE replicon stabilization toxin [Caballeronia sordidicola]
MVWRIEVLQTAENQLAKLDRVVARRIVAFLRDRVSVMDDPRAIGEALKGSELGEFWKYRVGDWRLICQIENAHITITVLRLGNRRGIYH